MRTIRSASVLTLLLVATGLTQAQTPTQNTLSRTKAEAVDKAVAAEMEGQGAVGVAIGLIEEGKIVYLQGYGWEDRDNKIPVTTETMFRWASCSKPVTAVAALQLVENGRLDLEADVRTLVPEFPDKGVPVTIRQLLCHQGGIVHYTNGKVVRMERNDLTKNPFEDVVLALDTFKDSELVCQPGEKFSYTTHGYILLSAAVERAGKQKFADQVAERILKPLDMKSMQPDYQWVKIPDRAVGYVKTKEEIKTSTDTDVSWKLGGGGYISTVEDMARFAAGLLNKRLVSDKTESLMWTAQKTNKGATTTYGLGFTVGTYAGGKPRVGHTGSQEKTRTLMTLDPQDKRGIVIMTNSEYADPGKFRTAIYNALGWM